MLPYEIHTGILHISLRNYYLDFEADISYNHLDKIVSDLQILVIKTLKFTESMTKWFSANAFQIFFSFIYLSILSK